MTIEIFERGTNEVVKTMDLPDLKGFLFYWAMQGDSKHYDWRTKKEVA